MRVVAAVAVLAAGLVPGGAAFADHCPTNLPPVAGRVCNALGDPTRTECWYYPETGEIVCYVPG